MGQVHSEGFREQALRKVLGRGDKTIHEVAADLGMNALRWACHTAQWGKPCCT